MSMSSACGSLDIFHHLKQRSQVKRYSKPEILCIKVRQIVRQTGGWHLRGQSVSIQKIQRVWGNPVASIFSLISWQCRDLRSGGKVFLRSFVQCNRAHLTADPHGAPLPLPEHNHTHTDTHTAPWVTGWNPQTHKGLFVPQLIELSTNTRELRTLNTTVLLTGELSEWAVYAFMYAHIKCIYISYNLWISGLLKQLCLL